jgi:hypothetical protein
MLNFKQFLNEKLHYTPRETFQQGKELVGRELNRPEPRQERIDRIAKITDALVRRRIEAMSRDERRKARQIDLGKK